SRVDKHQPGKATLVVLQSPRRWFMITPEDERSRFAIPFGLDRYGTETYIEEAEREESYNCPECGEPLEVRKGPIRQYFAHWRLNPASKECDLRVNAWGPELSAKRREPPFRTLLKEKRLLLALKRQPYDGRYDLVGLMPSATWEEWLSWPPNISIQSVGVIDRLSRDSFHP